MKNVAKNRWNQKSNTELPLNGKLRICNLCARSFVPLTTFDRYCPYCKSGSELLKFSEWLPEIETVERWVPEHIAA